LPISCEFLFIRLEAEEREILGEILNSIRIKLLFLVLGTGWFSLVLTIGRVLGL
jgi:hypothetical protein